MKTINLFIAAVSVAFLLLPSRLEAQNDWQQYMDFFKRNLNK